jgi:dipeptidyl aminopeptidase/acylaminoacyl peptidase
VNDRRLRELLVTAPSPDDLHARRRSWAVVRAAFEAREPVRRRPNLRPALALAVLAALVAAAVSSPGEAVIERVREAIGIERAQPALFSLPAPGRVLVSSTRGVWIVQQDGSKRLLGRYREASWSPSGLFVVAARHNELAALDPKGDLRWSLPRPAVSLPRWAGLRGDTRVAYLSRDRLHVVPGDGTGDRAVPGVAGRVAPAWRRGTRHVLAYVDGRGRVVVYDADSRAVQFRVPQPGDVEALEWSRDGRLLIASGDGLDVYGGEAQRLGRWRLPGIVSAHFSPDGRRIAVLRRSDVLVLDSRRPRRAAPRRVFAGAGAFSGLSWSPDGRWLLIGWQTADQWVFVRVAGPRRIEAVSNVSAQFRSRGFPTIAGWCCAP